MEARVDGKVALVTGATQGIGRAVAETLARAGAAGLLLTGRDEVRGNAAQSSVASHMGASFWIDETANKPGPEGSIIFQKQSKHPIALQYYSYNPALPAPGEIRFKRLDGKDGDWATDLKALSARYDALTGRIELDQYAPASPYQVSNGQVVLVVADQRCPVMYSP